MGFIFGAIIGSASLYGLIGWILRIKYNKRFILAGVISWLISVIMYSFFSRDSMSFSPTAFLMAFFMYLIGVSIWVSLALLFDKKGWNIKWILKYIPIGSFLFSLFAVFLSIMFTFSVLEQKNNTTVAEVKNIAVSIKNLYMEYDDYTGLNKDTIFNAIGISDVNPYGGIYSVEPYTDDVKMFVVSITNVPAKACSYLTKYKWVDSVLYQLNNELYSGAISVPEDCSSGNNLIQILF